MWSNDAKMALLQLANLHFAPIRTSSKIIIMKIEKENATHLKSLLTISYMGWLWPVGTIWKIKKWFQWASYKCMVNNVCCCCYCYFPIAFKVVFTVYLLKIRPILVYRTSLVHLLHCISVWICWNASTIRSYGMIETYKHRHIAIDPNQKYYYLLLNCIITKIIIFTLGLARISFLLQFAESRECDIAMNRWNYYCYCIRSERFGFISLNEPQYTHSCAAARF